MSVTTTHGVIAEPIGSTLAAGQVNAAEEYPVQSGIGITETSEGVSLPGLRTLINRAAGRINAMLVSRGITPTDIDGDELAAVQAGIVAYAIAHTLKRAQRLDLADQYAREWDDVVTLVRDMPGELGDADNPSAHIASNVPGTRITKRRYGTDFQGF